MKLKLTGCMLCCFGLFAQLQAAKENRSQYAPLIDAPLADAPMADASMAEAPVTAKITATSASTPDSESSSEDVDSKVLDLVVSPSNTQAREVVPPFGPAKTPRLLTGLLTREIATEGPTYPIRLRSLEGRLIACVDLSGVFISDLSPYLDQRVYLRGQVHPLPNHSSQLVILAQEIRLAE
jgi:hypothetical protein